jgi:phage-related protein
VIQPLAAAIAGVAVTFGVITVAVRTWAAAQAILNFALTANPIGLVIVAVGALVGLLVYAWRNSETFRNVVLGVLGAIREGWNILWESVLRPFFSWLSDRWDEHVLAFKVVQLAFAIGWEAVKSAFGSARDFVAGVFGWLSDRWDEQVAAFEVVQVAFAIGWDAVRSAFGSARDFIAGVWASIRSGAESAVNFVIRNLNFLIDGFNAAIRLANRLPLIDIPEIPSVPEVGAQQSSGGAARVPSRERGGPVSAGRLFQVNEAGVEFFVPNVAGTVLPVPLAVDAAGPGRTVTQTNYFTILNPDPQQAAREVTRELRRQEARA